MILMWLGSFALMMYGLFESQKHMASLFDKMQRALLEKGSDTNLLSTFFRSVSLVLTEASPQRSLYSAFTHYNLRITELLPSCLRMTLSTLGAWWVLILGLLFLSVNGSFLMGLSVVTLLTLMVSPKLKVALKILFYSGLFLVSGELMLKNSSIVQTMLGQSELAFFLADGRFPSVISLLIVALLLSLIVQVEFWTFALALSLLLTNTISLNGAMGLVAGERLGRMLFFWWQTRSLNQDCRRIGTQLSLVSSGGVVLGLLFAGEIRSYIIFDLDLSNFQDKSLQFVILFSVILAFQFFAQMIWGHFCGRAKVDELQEVKYIPASWKHWELLSPVSLAWAHDKVQKRLSEVRYHIQGLGTLKEGQVPEPLQARLKAEEVQLNRFLHDSN